MSKANGYFTDLARMFRILGDETRLRILAELQDGEMNVTQLCKTLRVPQPTVSHHLGILRMGDLVTSRRNGKEIFYSTANLDPQRYVKAFQAALKKKSSFHLGPLALSLQ